MRRRGAGGVPGAKYGGKISTELETRSESILESIRTPKPVLNPIRRWRILRGDFVEVVSGPEKGKRGRVLEVVRASNRVVVQGAGLVTKWVPQVGTERKKPVETEAPIYVSRVAVVCPQTDRPTRVVFAYTEDGTKVRVAQTSGAVIPRPDVLRERRKKRSDDPLDQVRDTPSEEVLKRTYNDERMLYESLEGGFEGNIEIFPNKST